ncbi:hypothetical protein FS749_009078 [Ceratobasidium sp. UAMH 11750]|nr:hypothetical protein FS749_009078 [Ceratobasidium sp. UAMH 11750]
MIQTIIVAMGDALQLRVVYQLLYAYLFGSSFIAFRALPRQQFGMLQFKTFPIFFSTSTAITALLLSIWTMSHPEVRATPLNLGSPVVLQAWFLISALVSHGLNLLYLGPKTSEVMFERHKLERSEKKQSSDPTASAEMKALNKQFGVLHGISSLVNLLSFLCMLSHGVWIGSRSTAL